MKKRSSNSLNFLKYATLTCWSGKKVSKKVFNWSELYIFKVTFLQKSIFKYVHKKAKKIHPKVCEKLVITDLFFVFAISIYSSHFCKWLYFTLSIFDRVEKEAQPLQRRKSQLSKLFKNIQSTPGCICIFS